MRKPFFVVALLALFSCKGKKEAEGNEFLPDKVVTYYNNEKYDSIFLLLSKEMKDQLPLDKTKAFFSQLRKDAGSIERSTLISSDAAIARYRVEFQNSTFWMDISQNRYGKIDGLLFKPYDGPEAGPVRRNQTKLSLPFEGEWFVFWGGDTKEQNYHVISRAQKHAFDIIITGSEGKSFKTNGLTNEDYYAFGQPLLAPCEAEVVTVTEGVKDNIPGEMNPAQLTGNTVVLKTSANEYLLFAHFKLNSIKVKAGDKVTRGQLLGLCGNSGNSSEPHLHFHIQDKEQMQGATGIKCYFDSLLVNGNLKTDHSPVKGERVRNK